MRRLPVPVLAATLGTLFAGPALAWSAGGHLVTAGLAYDDLSTSDPAALTRVLAILEHHPDRGAFQVAAGDLTGAAHDLALFEECARWPDDARGTSYDHPTWHYTFKPLVLGGPARATAPTAVDGDAEEALILNARVLGNPAAPPADRAVALCWVVHVVADMHQPLHAAQLFSPAFPDGDHGGAVERVRDPADAKAISLHWLWDRAMLRSVEPDEVRRATAAFEAASSDKPPYPTTAEALFQTVASESYDLARRDAYTSEVAAAFTPSEAYIQRMDRIAKGRAALAGHRIAALLSATLAAR